MIKKYLIISFFLSTAIVYSQTDTIEKETVLAIVEEMPVFPGGEGEMMKFIQRNVTYPQAEKEKGIGGKCYITFIVEKDGSITNINVLKGVFNGAGCDKEAMRVVSIMPKWKPGKQNGKEVRVQFNLPIKFTSIQVNAPIQLTPEEKEKINTSNIHYNKAVEFAKKDDYENALNEFNEVLKIFPKDAEALYNKGYMFYKLNKNEDACAIWVELKKSGNSIADNMLNKTCLSASSQTDSTKEPPLTSAEKMPSFPGGVNEMMKFIQKNVRYPQAEKNSGIMGTCYLIFIVEKDGSISDIKILKGVTNGPGCDKEAIRVISIMPKWDPGSQNGKNVRVQFNLPIGFRL